MRRIYCLAIAFVMSVPRGARGQERPRLPQGPQGTVTLPVADYDRLIDRAAQPDSPAESPPVASVMTHASLRARVDGGIARGTLRLDGETYARGHVKVPLVSGTTLLEAH